MDSRRVVDLKYKDIVNYIKKDKEQLKLLKMLADKRDMRLVDIVKMGVFAVPDEGELGYLLEKWGMDFEGAFGKDEEDINLVTNGFIIPVLDSRRRILFYINYNWERSKGRHYINVFPNYLRDLPLNMKMYGAHNMVKGLQEGWIVAVEGLFDAKRLELSGIPSVALLGSKLTTYQKRFLSRFDLVVYIPDNDFAGEEGWQQVSRSLSNVVRYNVGGLVKDVDEMAGKRGYGEWIEKLKGYRIRGI